MTGLVGEPAARQPQLALPWRLPMDWAFPMFGLVVQLAARRLQVALLARLLMDGPFNGQEGKRRSRSKGENQ